MSRLPLAVVAGMKKPNDHAEPTKVNESETETEARYFVLLVIPFTFSIIIKLTTFAFTVCVCDDKIIHIVKFDQGCFYGYFLS